jgi:flavin-dependent dehydrogenase
MPKCINFRGQAAPIFCARLPVIPPEDNYVISLANLCRWLAEKAELPEVEIYPGFAGTEVLYNDDDSVKGSWPIWEYYPKRNLKWHGLR